MWIVVIHINYWISERFSLMEMSKIGDMKVGMSHTKMHNISREMILTFGSLTKDRNPLHRDDDFSSKTQFGQINAQGMLLASHIIGLIGSSLPGPGWMCLGVDSTFNNPVFPDENVQVTVTVKKIIVALGVVVLEGEMINSDGIVVCRAQIKVKQLEDRV